MRELALQSDILVENFKVGGLAKYGLDYDSLKELNPRLIYCSITGFGQTGYASRPGYDFMIQGMGGLMSITGERDDLRRRSAEGGRGGGRPDDRHVFHRRHPGGAARAQQERPGPARGHGAAGLPGGHAGQPEPELHDLRQGAAPRGNAHQNLVPYQVFAASDNA